MSDERKFKVGDKVVVFGGHGLFERFDEISRMTPTGRIKLKGAPKDIYNPDGWERTSSAWHYTQIKHDTPELRQEIQDDEDFKKFRAAAVNFPYGRLTLPQLRELKALLDRFEGEKEVKP